MSELSKEETLYLKENYKSVYNFILKHPYYLLWWVVSKIFKTTLTILLLPFVIVSLIIWLISILFEKISDFLYIIQEIYGSCIKTVMSSLYYRRVVPRMNRILDRILEKEMKED